MRSQEKEKAKQKTKKETMVKGSGALKGRELKKQTRRNWKSIFVEGSNKGRCQHNNGE
jgi:hypothetical protein